MIPSTKTAYRLFIEGSITLARMEANGLPVCERSLDRNIEQLDQSISDVSSKLKKHPVYAEQRKKYGKETSLGSRDQLATILFDCLKVPGGVKSPKSGRYIMDEEAVDAIDNDYLDDYISLQKMHKIRGTYLQAFRRDTIDGRLRGHFNLHNVKSFRGSSDSPNLQNLPARNKTLLNFVKGTIVPPKDHVLVEIDFKNLEVFVACSYHKDPTMIRYLDTDYDMHMDIARQTFMFGDEFTKENPKKAKELRQAAKGFSFSLSYGDYYASIARKMWKDVNKLGMAEHLHSQGIKRLGMEFDYTEGEWIESHGEDAFVTKIRSMENHFWDVLFRDYGKWRKDWYNQYLARGYFTTLTGFSWYGVERRNGILNYCVQGAAYHCLLQSMIWIQKEIDRTRMSCDLICQVHDSLLAIVHKDQLHEYVGMCTMYMTTKLREAWPWQVITLKVETEYSYVSWADKQLYTGTES